MVRALDGTFALADPATLTSRAEEPPFERGVRLLAQEKWADARDQFSLAIDENGSFCCQVFVDMSKFHVQMLMNPQSDRLPP